ncbi:extracellular solute-binding protein [Lacrimispora sp.]|uniref:extracellular solute-binding protein n=1 Tax=Lacrimispora sp. TaxID=2719234 RepID=UPI0028A9F71F|nr:extracellular solute-binding protein [Lacrimispora sp.]
MKKKQCLMIAGVVLAFALTACSKGGEKTSGNEPDPAQKTAAAMDSGKAGIHQELDGVRMKETTKITVEVYDRANDGGSKPEDNFYTNYIKEGMLRDHNIEVEFIPVPRWTETEQINNLLAGGSAPDICVSYSYPVVSTYSAMGAVVDMAPILEDYKDVLPNLWELLGEENLYYNKDPKTGSIYAIESLRANQATLCTFVRADWLKKLNMKEPASLEEFETMLYAFRDNAEMLLGADAAKLVSLAYSFDAGWRAQPLVGSFVPTSMTEKDYYINNFASDRLMTYPNVKEGYRLLNKWYNDSLIWKDFAIYPTGDPTEDNMIKAGYVGASIGPNWDYPYRNGEDSIQANIRRATGDEAAGMIAIDPFQDDTGARRKYIYSPAGTDRKIFFPATNKEPVASALYLDWISQMDNRLFLQFGEEGVTCETQGDGAVKTLSVTGEKIMNSINNTDYTLTINGLKMKDEETTLKTVALGYDTVSSDIITKAYYASMTDGFFPKHYNLGDIEAESGIEESLRVKRDAFLDQAVSASVDKFDAIFDSGFADYLASGAQAVIDERTDKWQEFFGDSTNGK